MPLPREEGGKRFCGQPRAAASAGGTKEGLWPGAGAPFFDERFHGKESKENSILSFYGKMIKLN